LVVSLNGSHSGSLQQLTLEGTYDLKKFLKDNFGQEYTMEIIETKDTFSGILYDRGEHVGHMGCKLYTTKQMNLDEVYIRDDSDPLDGSISPGGRAKNYRNKGLGTKLLKLAINYARNRRAKFIYGSVTKEDISRTPFLLQFYERRGFKKSGPYKGCLPDAVAWICLELD
jgi:GNAT superfamily N-acetyltransferase